MSYSSQSHMGSAGKQYKCSTKTLFEINIELAIFNSVWLLILHYKEKEEEKTQSKTHLS